jgi:hypothetical protein
MNIRPAIIGLALAAAAAPAFGQAWDAPSFFSPRPGEDIGIYGVKPDATDDWGMVGIWRTEGRVHMGVRAGLLAGESWMVGFELHGPLAVAGPQSPILMSWVMGGGAAWVSDRVHARVPVGVSVGIALGTPGAIVLTPYVHPRVALDLLAYDLPGGQERTETDFRFDLDVGVDAALGQSLVLRAGATIGDRNTFGAGIAWRMPRRLIVR